jgi:hypothetical protein
MDMMKVTLFYITVKLHLEGTLEAICQHTERQPVTQSPGRKIRHRSTNVVSLTSGPDPTCQRPAVMSRDPGGPGNPIHAASPALAGRDSRLWEQM